MNDLVLDNQSQAAANPPAPVGLYPEPNSHGKLKALALFIFVAALLTIALLAMACRMPFTFIK